MATATSELDALLTAVMNSLRQPQEKATQWNAALAASLVTQKSQLAELLSTERKEKKAGNGGCEGWRTVLLREVSMAGRLPHLVGHSRFSQQRSHSRLGCAARRTHRACGER